MGIVASRPSARRRFPYIGFRSAYPEFTAELTLLRQRRQKVLTALAEATVRERHSSVRRILRDRRLHLLYAYDALRRTGRLRGATPQIIEELATRFNPFAPVVDERVITRLIDKGSGRRWVQDFGPVRRMQQALVADVLRYLHPPLRGQKLFNGGMPTALNAVATAYADGFTHGVEVDFVNFYGSVRPEALAGLLRPLPTSVVEHVVWDQTMRNPYNVVVVPSEAYPTPSTTAGLSLGAATSPIVGEKIIAHLLTVAQLEDTITYADNLFILGRSEAEVTARIHLIKEGVANLDVGVLGLRFARKSNFELTVPFEFVKAQGEARDGRVVWRPGAAKINQYQASATDFLPATEIEAAERRVSQWRRSYAGWDEGDAHEAEYLAALKVRRFYLDADPAHLSAAVHAIVVAYLAWGRRREMIEFIPTEGDVRGNHRERLLGEIERWIDAAVLRERDVDAA